MCVAFSRTVRRSHRRKRIETKLVDNVEVALDYYSAAPEDIRKELAKSAPEGEGWGIACYGPQTHRGDIVAIISRETV